MAGLSSFFGSDRRPPAVDVDHARDHTQDPVPHPPARRAAARASTSPRSAAGRQRLPHHRRHDRLRCAHRQRTPTRWCSRW